MYNIGISRDSSEGNLSEDFVGSKFRRRFVCRHFHDRSHHFVDGLDKGACFNSEEN